MKNLKFIVYFLLIVGLLLVLRFKRKNYYILPTFKTELTINAIIEIPAGTNKKYEYNPYANRFVHTENRIVNFLPFPGNYGFIPSTMMDTTRGGDGDALDILVISEHVKRKTVMEVIPIAVLRLKDKNETDDKIIAVPADNDDMIIKAKSFAELEKFYPEVIRILETWFSSYNSTEKAKILGWENEKEALKIINLWSI